MRARPKSVSNAMAVMAVASSDAELTPIALLAENTSNAGKDHERGTTDLQVAALATILEVAGSNVSAKNIVRLAEINDQLDRVRRELELAIHSPEPNYDAVRELILQQIAAWKPRKSARPDLIAELISLQVPVAARPWSHQVRATNIKFYDGLKSALSDAGAKLSDFFPIAEGTGGGAIRGRAPKSDQEKAEMLQARRQRNRDRMRGWRARHPAP